MNRTFHKEDVRQISEATDHAFLPLSTWPLQLSILLIISMDLSTFQCKGRRQSVFKRTQLRALVPKCLLVLFEKQNNTLKKWNLDVNSHKTLPLEMGVLSVPSHPRPSQCGCWARVALPRLKTPSKEKSQMGPSVKCEAISPPAAWEKVPFWCTMAADCRL